MPILSLTADRLLTDWGIYQGDSNIGRLSLKSSSRAESILTSEDMINWVDQQLLSIKNNFKVAFDATYVRYTGNLTYEQIATVLKEKKGYNINKSEVGECLSYVISKVENEIELARF